MLLQEECLPGEVRKGGYRKVRQTMVGGQQNGKALAPIRDQVAIATKFHLSDENVATPDLYAAVYRLVREGRAEEARPLSDAFTAFLAVGWKYGILDTFEELMRARGWASRCFRRPSSWNPGKIPEAALSDLLGRMEAIDALVGAL